MSEIEQDNNVNIVEAVQVNEDVKPIDLTKEEKRRLYSKQYYAKNRKQILQKILGKEQCSACGKKVAHQNMKEHKRSLVCQPRMTKTDVAEMKTNILSLKKQVSQLSFKNDFFNEISQRLKLVQSLSL